MAEPISWEAISQRYADRVEQALRTAVSGDGEVFRALAYHLETGGKRLRAFIPSWVSANLGADPDEALPYGLAIELVHNGTLVHDDVQDGDAMRRGRPAVWSAFGLPQAINAGSWLMFKGASLALEASLASRTAGLVEAAVLRVIEGQALEFELQQAPMTVLNPDSWEAMARAKTGALFACAFETGAHAAGCPPDEAAAIGRYGEALGVFFQIQDDLVDLLADKGRGVRATDIEEGKISHPVAWAIAHGPRPAAERLHAIVQTPRGDTSRAMVDEALGILAASGALTASLASLGSSALSLDADPASRLAPGLIARVLEPLAGHLEGLESEMLESGAALKHLLRR